ncbi:prestin-like [Clavelina lepadiformis]|uniref:prestin-like n=1 Tax=Clavelina lepadiformis TaxID=159417 RepID=UPI004042E5B0
MTTVLTSLIVFHYPAKSCKLFAMCDFEIKRPILTEKNFQKTYDVESETQKFDWTFLKTKVKGYVRSKVDDPGGTAKRFFLSLFPIITWLRKYPIKEWLVSDIISGLTIGVMQIPQGMSYSLLAGQHPIHGLYNAFFPAILYSILGTSRHVSMGAFAITSLMMGAAVTPIYPDPIISLNATDAEQQAAWDAVYDVRIQYSVATLLIVGVFLLGLSLLNLGSIVMYLSDPMISGFTCGAAVHVFLSQLKGLFGVKIGSYSGPLNVVWVIRDVIIALTTLDEAGRTKTAATVVISVICVVFLLIVKQINERYQKKYLYGIPIPGEIVVVIVGTGISYGVNLHDLYGVSIVGNIPSGLPVPVAPPVSELSSVVGTAIPIAIVGYSVAVSIAKIFGNNFGYKIKPNQELVAYGVSNTVGSFFLCVPAFPSMSRSCVQVDSGGKTQLVGLISAAVILLVLLVIGPLFEQMPRACLAAIIAVAIKGMLRKARDFRPLWRINKLDGAIWMVACIATIFLDVVFGLVTGVAFSFLCVVFRTQFIKSESVTRVSNTEIYRRTNDAASHNDVIVIAFHGPLHYVNKDRLRHRLIKETKLDPALEKAKNKKRAKARKESDENVSDQVPNVEVIANKHTEENLNGNLQSMKEDVEAPPIGGRSTVRAVILDCSQMSFMDSVGVKFLKKAFEDYNELGIEMMLSHVEADVMYTLERGGFIEKFGYDVIFLTNHDAVLKNSKPSHDETHL